MGPATSIMAGLQNLKLELRSEKNEGPRTLPRLMFPSCKVIALTCIYNNLRQNGRGTGQPLATSFIRPEGLPSTSHLPMGRVHILSDTFSRPPAVSLFTMRV